MRYTFQNSYSSKDNAPLNYRHMEKIERQKFVETVEENLGARNPISRELRRTLWPHPSYTEGNSGRD